MLERTVVFVGRARFPRTVARAIPASALCCALLIGSHPPYEGDMSLDRPAGRFAEEDPGWFCQILRSMGLPCPGDPEPVEEPPVPPYEPIGGVIQA